MPHTGVLSLRHGLRRATSLIRGRHGRAIRESPLRWREGAETLPYGERTSNDRVIK